MRKEIFIANAKYRVKSNFINGGINFIDGEVLTFVRDGYSPYDDCFMYEFYDQHGNIKTWILPIDSSELEWQQLFEQIE